MMIRQIIMHVVLLLLPLITLFDHLLYASAFPGAAGHCESGDLSGKSSGHGESGGGPLSNGSLQVTFNNSPLQTYSTASLSANTVYAVKLSFTTSNSNFFFRGLLFRLSGSNGESAEGTFSVSSDSNVQLKSGCADGISAMTHNSRTDKTSVEFEFEYTQSTSANLLLEVTVVRERASDNWFYSSYNLQIGNGSTPAPTPSPITSTSAPTPSPVNTPTPCEDSTLRFRIIKPDGSRIFRDCSWAAKKSTTQRCSWNGVSSMCPDTCGVCETYSCVDGLNRFKLDWKGKRIARNCVWVANKQTETRCSVNGVSETCRGTCGDAC